MISSKSLGDHDAGNVHRNYAANVTRRFNLINKNDLEMALNVAFDSDDLTCLHKPSSSCYKNKNIQLVGNSHTEAELLRLSELPCSDNGSAHDYIFLAPFPDISKFMGQHITERLT